MRCGTYEIKKGPGGHSSHSSAEESARPPTLSARRKPADGNVLPMEPLPVGDQLGAHAVEAAAATAATTDAAGKAAGSEEEGRTADVEIGFAATLQEASEDTRDPPSHKCKGWWAGGGREGVGGSGVWWWWWGTGSGGGGTGPGVCWMPP